MDPLKAKVDPIGERPTSEPIEKQPHPVYVDRWTDGTMRPGHPGPAFVHGARSALAAVGALPQQEHVADLLLTSEAAILKDLGGVDAVSALALGQVKRHVKLALIEATLWDSLQRLGLVTGKGRTRAATTLWLQVVDRLQKSSLALGLERRARQVDPLEAVRRAVVEANER